MESFLQDHPSQQKISFDQSQKVTIVAILKHFFLRESWNRIGQANGFLLHTDHLHLNDLGAEMVVDLISEFLS
jgi:uncharacterized protein (DUF2164 family)